MGDSLPTRSHDDLPPLPLGLAVGLVGLALLALAALMVGIALAGVFLMASAVIMFDLFPHVLPSIISLLTLIAFICGFGVYHRAHRRTCLIIVGLLVPTVLISGALPYPHAVGPYLLIPAAGAHLCIAAANFALGVVSRNYVPDERIQRSLAAGRCPWCGYDIRNLPEPRCPECGMALIEQ